MIKVLIVCKDNLTANLKVCDAIEMDYPNDYFDFAIDNFSIFEQSKNDFIPI